MKILKDLLVNFIIIPRITVAVQKVPGITDLLHTLVVDDLQQMATENVEQGPIRVNVWSLGTDAVIAPGMQVLLEQTQTINYLKQQIFEQRLCVEADPVYYQSYMLFFGHGGTELKDGFQLVRDSLLYDNCTVLVAINAQKDELMFTTDNTHRCGFFSAPPELCDDKDVVIAYCCHYPDGLMRLPEKWRADKDVIMAVVSASGCALQFASDDLRADRDVVMAAITTWGIAYDYVLGDLRDDMDVVKTHLTHWPYGLYDLPAKLRANREFVLTAVMSDGAAVQFASDDLRADKDIMLAAVSQNGDALDYALGDLFDNKDVVTAAVTQSNYALVYASGRLQNDPDVRKLMRDWGAYKYLKPERAGESVRQ